MNVTFLRLVRYGPARACTLRVTPAARWGCLVREGARVQGTVHSTRPTSPFAKDTRPTKRECAPQS